ncbi:MAG: sulfite exporter TauE/SafE family protein [Clostridia bacterium]|nr:sulfite exporter TauE/SafE family protein [Clostridia bacterium]
MFALIIASVVASVLAGMGIGGGALFVMILTNFLSYPQKEAQALNLVLFVASGIGSTISNIKNKKIDKNFLNKIVPLITFGAIVGTGFFGKTKNETLKMCFSVFMALVGIYEIISSLIKLKKAKNIKKSEERSC